MAEKILVRATLHPVPLERSRVMRDPATGRNRYAIYPDTPREVPMSTYYQRRLMRGELELVKPTASAPKGKKE